MKRKRTIIHPRSISNQDNHRGLFFSLRDGVGCKGSGLRMSCVEARVSTTFGGTIVVDESGIASTRVVIFRYSLYIQCSFPSFSVMMGSALSSNFKTSVFLLRDS